MLRVLTLSTLFPNMIQPTLGIFVERQTLGLAAQAGVAVEVVSPVGMPPWPLSLHPHYRRRRLIPAQEQWKGLTVHRPVYPVLPAIGQQGTARRMAAAILPGLRVIRERFAFDVIDAEFFWPDGPAAMILAAALDVPFLVKARGSDINFWSGDAGIRTQIEQAGRAAGKLLAVSAALKQEMAQIGIPAERIAVHYTGVDLNRFAPADRSRGKARLGIDGPLLVCIGALVERKGQALALEALADIPEATLILVGEGPDRKGLEALVASLGLTGRVRLPGVLPHEEVADLLAVADVMVLPTYSEGLANAWIEAMASGTPVVTCDVGGAREAVPPEAGRLVEHDPTAIADAVRALIETPPDRDGVRKAALRFSWDTNSRELLAHLSALTGG